METSKNIQENAKNVEQWQGEPVLSDVKIKIIWY